MLTYCVVLWILVTLGWAGSDRLRRSGLAFAVWVLITAAALWPVSHAIERNRTIQAVVQTISADFMADLHRDSANDQSFTPIVPLPPVPPVMR